MAEPELIQLQATPSQPIPQGLESATDLLLPPRRSIDRLSHFPEEVYDLSAESHLSRFVKVLMGDAGAGQLRKRYLISRLQQTLQGSHFFDLDRFYGALFGIKRLTEERLSLDPYSETADADTWAEEHAKDASYRSRIEQFARAINYGPTPTGMETVAEALLCVDCDVYEAWVQADSSYQTYGELEAQYPTYAALEGVNYGELQGTGLARLAGDERRLFIVRPKRQITMEEAYDLTRVLNKLKPAEARFVIESDGIDAHEQVTLQGVAADSTYWEVVPKVAARPTNRPTHPYVIASETPTEQPRPPFSGYQGEAWSYSADVIGVAAYEQTTPTGQSTAIPSQRIVFNDDSSFDFHPYQGVLSQKYIQAGRNVSDAILLSHPYTGTRESADLEGPMAPLYADRIPVGDLAAVMRSTEAQVSDTEQVNRFWVTQERPMENSAREVFEIRFASSHRINNVSFEVAHYPHTVTVEVYNNQSGTWTGVYTQKISDSVPKFVSPSQQLTPGAGHPMHSAPGHWVRCAARIPSVTTDRMRLVLVRTEGVPPRLPRRYATTYQHLRVPELASIDYSLAVRNLDAGYRVSSRADVPAGGEIIDSSVDVLGSLVQFNLREEAPGRILGTEPKPWKCEPQPFNYAVVNFFLDTRDIFGAGQIIDKFFLAPTHTGPHITLYYSNDEILPDIQPVNLLHPEDASLENNVGSWEPLSGATVTRTNIGAVEGSVALRIVGTHSSFSVKTGNGADYRIPVRPGAQYTAIATFRAAGDTGRAARVGIRWLNAALTPVAPDDFGSGITEIPEQSLPDSHTTNAPVGAVWANLILQFPGAPAGEAHDVDAIGIFEGGNTQWYPPGPAPLPEVNEGVLGNLAWTPIARDYTLQKGYLHIPPTKAKFWKFEFTNLVPEPYESLLPILRKVKLFTPEQVRNSMHGIAGVADQEMPAGTIAAITLNQALRYQDAFQAITVAALNQQQYSPTEALYAPDPNAAKRLGNVAWFYNFTPWHQGQSAPRFVRTDFHRYREVEIYHSSKVAFFVGLKDVRAYRVKYEADDDAMVIYDRFHDFRNIRPGFTWTFNPNTLATVTNTSAVATSVPINSRHNVRAIQFATQQSEPIQLVPDDDFRDPALATYTWDNLDQWNKVGDVQVLYNDDDHSIQMLRHVTPPPKAINRTGGLIQGIVQPVFSYRPLTSSDEAAAAATFGGIQSGLLGPSSEGLIYAAARITVDSDLTNPVVLQIVSGGDTNKVLAEKPVFAHKGEMVEWYVGYNVNSSDPVTADDTVRVRVIQRGKSNDSWRLDTLSLFDEGIIWEFSVDGGRNFLPGRGIRNNPNGVLTFPEPGNQLVWRVRGVRPYMAVTSLQIRPWYVGLENSRSDGAHRGPNVSSFDQDPPIHQDPEFAHWSKPIPRSWFYTSKRFPLLPVSGAPNVTPFSRFYGRSVTEELDAISDAATKKIIFGRFGVERMDFFQPLSESASRTGIFKRNAAASVPAPVDAAYGTVIPPSSDSIINIPVHPT